MLVELGLVEQRQKAVLEVLGGRPVTEVARRYGVTRQTVHRWLKHYGCSGLAGLADHSSRPATCPHQMSAVVEAGVVELRWTHPGTLREAWFFLEPDGLCRGSSGTSGWEEKLSECCRNITAGFRPPESLCLTGED